MTREQFLNDVTDFYDLKMFCYRMSIDLLDDVCDEDGRDSEINYFLAQEAHDYDWEQIRDSLNGIPTGRGWFFENGWDDWVTLDDGDFDTYKQEVLDLCDNDSLWDESDEEGPTPSSPSDVFPISDDPDFLSLYRDVAVHAA